MTISIEHLCNEIKEKAFVDFDNEEVQDMMNAMDILMNRFVDEFRRTYPEVKIERLLLCGSMAEKSCVWRTDNRCDAEFDYLAVVTSWPGCTDFSFEHALYGEMEIKHKVADCNSPTSTSVYLRSEIKFSFADAFIKCVTDKCRQNLCTLRLYNYEPDQNGCQFCSVYMNTGSLKCANLFESLWNKSYGKLSFVWTSKNKSVVISHSWDIMNRVNQQSKDLTNFLLTRTENIRININESFTSSFWCDEDVSVITLAVDFHPVIKLDVGRIVRKTKFDPAEKCLFFPNVVHLDKFNRCLKPHYLIKELKFAHYLINFVSNTMEWKITMAPKLSKNRSYLLFPKNRTHDSYRWRISVCQLELDILRNTSDEHIVAYRVLKFLLVIINTTALFKIQTYEAKVAFLKHIKGCKTPTVGAHICLLNIIHEIAMCKDFRTMVHPMLNMNLYDMFLNRFREKNDAICLKVLTLILLNERGRYAVADFVRDWVSINIISEINCEYSNVYSHSFLIRTDVQDAICGWKNLIKRRKNNSSKVVLNEVVMELLRTNRRKKLQADILRNNSSYPDHSRL